MVKIKEINGYEGLYFVDTFGNVVSMPKDKHVSKVGEYVILKPQVKRGYAIVNLYKNGKMKSYSVHRLVAKAFIENPNEYKQVNHINGIKLDNRVENLEWCTAQYNTKHAYDNNLNGFKDRVAVYQKNHSYKNVKLIKNGLELIFDSTQEAAIFLKVKKESVCECILYKKKIRGYDVTGEK